MSQQTRPTAVEFYRLKQLVEVLQNRCDALNRLCGPQPSPQPKRTTFEVDLETHRQMNIQAQFVGLRNGEELTQIVLHAFLDMMEEETCLTFPLTLQQVTTVA